MPVGIIAKNSFVGINLLHSRTLGRQRARAKFKRAMGRMRKKHARARMMRKLKKLNEARKPSTKAEEVLAGAQSGQASLALASGGLSDGNLSVPQPHIGLGGRAIPGRMDDDFEVSISDAKESKSPDKKSRRMVPPPPPGSGVGAVSPGRAALMNMAKPGLPPGGGRVRSLDKPGASMNARGKRMVPPPLPGRAKSARDGCVGLRLSLNSSYHC